MGSWNRLLLYSGILYLWVVTLGTLASESVGSFGGILILMMTVDGKWWEISAMFLQYFIAVTAN
jgi:hypothetical protein